MDWKFNRKENKHESQQGVKTQLIRCINIQILQRQTWPRVGVFWGTSDDSLMSENYPSRSVLVFKVLLWISSAFFSLLPQRKASYILLISTIFSLKYYLSHNNNFRNHFMTKSAATVKKIVEKRTKA